MSYRGFIIKVFDGKTYAIKPGERLAGPFANQTNAMVWIAASNGEVSKPSKET